MWCRPKQTDARSNAQTATLNQSQKRHARIFRLGWDFAGTGLAGRNEQYERFCLASAPRNYQMAQMMADRTRANALVGRFLDEPWQ